jgi:hypothetical protein
MGAVTLKPDLAAANSFLDALDPGGVFTFQTFPEGPHDGPVPSPQIMHGTLADLAERLTALNSAGHGIFVMVNEGDLAGRRATNVKRIRAFCLDLDGAPLEPVLECGLYPDIIVESSPGKWHAYWLTRDCPLNEFALCQKQLAEKFEGDPAVHDLPRVMRLPGFMHQKAAPFMTNLKYPE